MSSALDRIGGRPPQHVGQATAVEQARAVAEVAAAVEVAQRFPRNLQAARQQMLDSCAMTALAERAFFRYTRAGETVTGPSIHLARELARCWTNVQYGITELRRDDDAGVSEMMAWAWDVQTNTKTENKFIVPHARDTTKGRKPLEAMRDIYENNANNGARRVREGIFAVLPPWFTEEAKERCRATIEHGGGEPIAVRIDKMLTAFRGLGITDQQLIDKTGRKPDAWTVQDVTSLGVTFTSIRNGEVSKEEEFPPPRVTAAEIVGRRAPEPAPDEAPETSTGNGDDGDDWPAVAPIPGTDEAS